MPKKVLKYYGKETVGYYNQEKRTDKNSDEGMEIVP